MTPNPEVRPFPYHTTVYTADDGALQGHICMYGQHWVKLIMIRNDGMPECVVSIPREQVRRIVEDPMVAERNRPLLTRFYELQAHIKATQQSPQGPPSPGIPPTLRQEAQPTGPQTLDMLG